jgi:hypothetical protein
MSCADDRSISLCPKQMVSPRLHVYGSSVDNPITTKSFYRLHFDKDTTGGALKRHQ